MAHFAKIDENNNVVDCIVLHNDVVTSEEAGKEFIQNVLKKTERGYKLLTIQQEASTNLVELLLEETLQLKDAHGIR